MQDAAPNQRYYLLRHSNARDNRDGICSICKRNTRIIFTTAFSEYALEGYRVDALDYLLKPITYTKFLEATKKALKWFEMKESAQSKDAASSIGQEEEQMFVKADHKLIRILFKDILYIEGWKDYVKIHLTDRPHPILSLMSMKGLEETLPSTRFIRIHRSFIIQKSKIDSISKNRVSIETKNCLLENHTSKNLIKLLIVLQINTRKTDTFYHFYSHRFYLPIYQLENHKT